VYLVSDFNSIWKCPEKSGMEGRLWIYLYRLLYCDLVTDLIHDMLWYWYIFMSRSISLWFVKL
jgi:hypothetical protein